MCDACDSENKNWKFSNKPDSSLETQYLYRVFIGRVAKIKLCALHSIDLFIKGEQRFLSENINLAEKLWNKGNDIFSDAA